MELNLENGLNVIVSIMEEKPDGVIHSIVDSILVFFDSQAGNKYGVKYEL